MDVEDARDLVALNADVVGYSALVADDLEAMSAAMSGYHELVEQLVRENDGKLDNFVGDSFMAVFDDVMAALRTAISITTEAEARNTNLPRSRRIRFRMGMDQGLVSFSAGHHHGDPLNIAARIQAVAPLGGLAVSDRIYRALDEPALRFRAMGRQRMKNIPERVGVYEFVGLPTETPTHRVRRSLRLESFTLAVLPVHTEMVDDQVRAAAEMIRQDLMHRLSAIPDLTLIDAPRDPDGGLVGSAQYMIETGVHQFGEHVRVFAMLFDVNTMNVVKSHKWTMPAEQMFSVSEDIAEEVARSVDVELVVGEPARFYVELDDPLAIEKIYLGWFHLRDDTREGWKRALQMFSEVAASHPDQPYGYVLSGFAQWLGAANGWVSDVDTALTAAVDLARRGGDVGDQTGMSQAVEAAVLMSRGEVDEALARLDNLEIVRPTCDITFGLEGSVRRYLGQWERAVELLDTAMRLTGINKPWYPTVKATALFVGGRLDEAASLAEGVLEYQPNNLEALLVLAAAQSELGLDRRARGTSELIKSRFPSVDVGDWLERNPYQRRELVERWKGDLVSAGAMDAG
jgi:adenylate cyclase